MPIFSVAVRQFEGIRIPPRGTEMTSVFQLAGWALLGKPAVAPARGVHFGGFLMSVPGLAEAAGAEFGR